MFFAGMILGGFLGIVLMCLLQINKPDDQTLIDVVNGSKLAAQSRMVGALYSKKLHDMAVSYLSGKQIVGEPECPACNATYSECKCGLCK
jgi:hypothetical protein